jgi:magnesium-protoporphyrin IX monomethyl ester (oxidative) cyclase
MLEKEGHEVNVIDAVATDWQQTLEHGRFVYSGMKISAVLKELETLDPEIVGLSSPFTVNSTIVTQLMLKIRASFPDIRIVVGGADPTVRPNAYKNYADCVVMGEGEKAINAFHGQEKTLRMPYIEDLDQISFPCRELFPMDEYFRAYDLRRACRFDYIFHRRWTNLVTSRGCPFKCCFCSIHLSMGRTHRQRSVENVEAEMEHLIQGKLRIRHINFEDDNISLNRSFFDRFLRMIVRNKYDVSWSLPNGIRADTLNEETIRNMSKAGCRRLFVAPESGVQRVVNQIIHKNLDLSKVETAVKLFKKYNIIVDAAFVIGLIGETKQDILASFRYAAKLKRLGLNHAGFSIATPLYGTELYHQAIAGGYISEDLDTSNLSPFESVISTDEWDSAWIRRVKNCAEWSLNLPLWKKIWLMGKTFFIDRQWSLDLVKFQLLKRPEVLL